MLKVYQHDGPARFTLTPVLWVYVQDTKDTIVVEEGIAYRFQRWCYQNRIFTVIRAGSSGGGAYYGGFDPADGEKIRAWLLENGALEGEVEENVTSDAPSTG